MSIIPGMADDVARECLARIDYKQLPAVVAVSSGWKHEVEHPEFRRLRNAASSSNTIMVLAQAQITPSNHQAQRTYRPHPLLRLSVLNPDTREWSPLPFINDAEVPMFCQMVSAGTDLLLLGGLNTATWQVSRDVFAYSFLTGSWRRCARMPGVGRSFFACAADTCAGKVYVAGGHDEDKNALKSAMVYDVARDNWTQLPDMAEERDECKGVFSAGKMIVVGGYVTARQGRFLRSSQVFHVASGRWEAPDNGFLEYDACPKSCSAGGGDVSLFMCHEGQVVALRGTTWHALARVPDDVGTVSFVALWRGKLLVMGSPRFRDPQATYFLDLSSSRWTRLATPPNFSGYVQSGCCLDI